MLEKKCLPISASWFCEYMTTQMNSAKAITDAVDIKNMSQSKSAVNQLAQLLNSMQTMCERFKSNNILFKDKKIKFEQHIKRVMAVLSGWYYYLLTPFANTTQQKILLIQKSGECILTARYQLKQQPALLNWVNNLDNMISIEIKKLAKRAKKKLEIIACQ